MDDAELGAMYQQGLTLDEIARRTKISRPKVRAAVVRAGVELRMSRAPRRRAEPRPDEEGPLDIATLERLRRGLGLI